uniref:Apolipoprotein C-IV n=1 Tax=Gadus morhua TaxID=8049 RepID=A0A8C5FHV2_GADMO
WTPMFFIHLFIIHRVCLNTTCLLGLRANITLPGGVVTGEIMWDFAGFYYEENLKPVTDSCWDWASSTTNSMWDRVKKTIDDYRPSQTSPSG